MLFFGNHFDLGLMLTGSKPKPASSLFYNEKRDQHKKGVLLSPEAEIFRFLLNLGYSCLLFPNFCKISCRWQHCYEVCCFLTAKEMLKSIVYYPPFFD